jgi:hypothetical protein
VNSTFDRFRHSLRDWAEHHLVRTPKIFRVPRTPASLFPAKPVYAADRGRRIAAIDPGNFQVFGNETEAVAVHLGLHVLAAYDIHLAGFPESRTGFSFTVRGKPHDYLVRGWMTPLGLHVSVEPVCPFRRQRASARKIITTLTHMEACCWRTLEPASRRRSADELSGITNHPL